MKPVAGNRADGFTLKRSCMETAANELLEVLQNCLQQPVDIRELFDDTVPSEKGDKCGIDWL